MNTYWIKLYHCVLEDPKMGVLSDTLWRRTIELFLLAGQQNDGGQLPPTDQIAWALRKPVSEIESNLVEIERTGIIQRNERGWLVVKFTKRQESIPATERGRHYRLRRNGAEPNREREKNEPQTNHERETNEPFVDTDTDNKSDQNVARAFADRSDNVRTPENDPIKDWDELRDTVGEVLGCTFSMQQPDVQALNEMIKLGPTKADLRQVVKFFADRGKTARGPAHILESVRFQIAKRKQAGSAALAKPSKQSAADRNAEIDRLLAEV